MRQSKLVNEIFTSVLFETPNKKYQIETKSLRFILVLLYFFESIILAEKSLHIER